MDDASNAIAEVRQSGNPGPASGVDASAVSQPSKPSFLDKLRHPSAHTLLNRVKEFVHDFPADLARLQAARRLRAFLEPLGQELLGTEAFAAERGDAEAELSSLEALDKFVFLKLYKVLFRHQSADVREDERVEQKLRAVHQTSHLRPNSLPDQALQSAARELRSMDQYRTPRDKVVCLINARTLLAEVLPGAEGASEEAAAAKAELLAQWLVALLRCAVPSNFFSNLEFAAAFRRPEWLSDEERLCLAEFAAALATATADSAGQDAVQAVVAASLATVLSNRGPRGCGELPPWLMDAGVTLRFEKRSEDDILVGELSELLGEYQLMASALRTLAEGGGPS
jgi:hypothetical protein